MRSIKELIDQHEDVWFWIEKKYQDHFYNDLAGMKAVFMNGNPVTKGSITHYMSVYHDKIVRYVSDLVWHKTAGSAPLKVDYGKFIEEREDYVITESDIRKEGENLSSKL